MSPSDAPELCAEQEACQQTDGEAAKSGLKMVGARTSGTREMCRIIESQNSDNAPRPADKGKKNEDTPNPARSSMVLQSHVSEKHRRTNGHDCIEDDMNDVILLDGAIGSNENKMSNR